MKKYLLLLFLAIIISPVAIFASTITGADYKGDILASNNSSFAQHVSGNISISTPDWISANILNSSATNIAARDSAGNDIAVMPGYLTNPMILFLESIPDSGNGIYHIYTGNVSGGKIRYFPGATGMRVSDNSTIELGNNGMVSISSYLNTTAAPGKDIFSKYDAATGGIICSVSDTVSGNVSARIITSVTSTYVNITPNAAGTYTNIPNPAAPHWDDVDDPPGTPDDAATFVAGTSATTAYKDSYNLTTPTFSGDSQTITSVVVYFRGKGNGGANCKAQPLLIMNGTEVDGTEITLANNVWTTYSETITRPGGGSWSASDNLSGLQGGIIIKGSGVVDPYITQVYVRINYTYEDWEAVSLSGIDSGEHDVTVSLATGNFTLDIDGVTNTTVFAGSVPDTSANWTFGDESGTPYIESMKLEISGVEQGSWPWECAATFTDQSGHNHTGDPSFRTTCSDPDVTLSLTSFSPVTEAAADYDPDLDWPSIITTTPAKPGTMYTENSTPGVFFAPLIHAVWPLSGVPESFFWYNFTFITVIAAGILSFRIHPSLLLKIIVAMAIMIFWALPGPNVYGMFVVIYKGLYCFGILVLSKHYGW